MFSSDNPLSGCQLIRLSQETTILPFTCGDADLDEFLMNDAKEHLRYLSLVTYLLVSSEKTIAYFSLANDTIQYSSIDDFWEEMRDNLNIEKYAFLKGDRNFPAVKLARLAVHKDFQRNRIGEHIINYLIHSFTQNNKTGCQFITVDALNNSDTNKFYCRNGFQYFTNNDCSLPTRQMYKCLLAQIMWPGNHHMF